MKKSRVIAALGALAQETRLDIFRLLVQKGPEGLPAGEIGARLGQPSPTMSFPSQPAQICRPGHLAPRKPLNYLQRQLQGDD
jgi:hypothetical protein